MERDNEQLYTTKASLVAVRVGGESCENDAIIFTPMQSHDCIIGLYTFSSMLLILSPIMVIESTLSPHASFI